MCFKNVLEFKWPTYKLYLDINREIVNSSLIYLVLKHLQYIIINLQFLLDSLNM